MEMVVMGAMEQVLVQAVEPETDLVVLKVD